MRRFPDGWLNTITALGLRRQYQAKPKSVRRRRNFLAIQPLEQRELLTADFQVVSTHLDESDGDYSEGDLSLREALELAAAYEGPAIPQITFSPELEDETINLSSQLLIASDIEIDGADAPGLAISGNNSVRVFLVEAGGGHDVTFKNLTIEKGRIANGTSDSRGGGVRSEGNKLTLDTVVVQDNLATSHGGGIYTVDTELTIVDSTFADNTGYDSAAIFAYTAGGTATIASPVHIEGSAFTGNVGTGPNGHSQGGAVRFTQFNGTAGRATVKVVNSTFSDNSAPEGGAIAFYSEYIDASIVNSTITDNTSTNIKGALYNRLSGTQVTLVNTILAGNTAVNASDPNLAATLTVSSSHNFIGGNPLLAPLNAQGVHMPLPTSPVIDAGSNAAVLLLTDQLGLARIVDGNPPIDVAAVVDIGAAEYVPSPTLAAAPTSLIRTGTTLSWTAPSGSAHAGYEVQRSKTGLGEWRTIAGQSTLNSSTLSYNTQSLNGTEYFRVRAVNGPEFSTWSNIVSRTDAQEDAAIKLSAEVSAAPTPTIELTWRVSQSNVTAGKNYYVFRKPAGFDTDWGVPVVSAIPASSHVDGVVSWVDDEVAAGEVWEYRVSTSASHSQGNSSSIAAVVERQISDTDDRGTVVLVIDERIVTELSYEIDRLKADLIGDGWGIAVVYADPDPFSEGFEDSGSAVAEVKGAIKAIYDANPEGVKSVILLGDVPAPYSGKLAPDGHSGQSRSFATDLYYGDVDGAWTVNPADPLGRLFYSQGWTDAQNFNDDSNFLDTPTPHGVPTWTVPNDTNDGRFDNNTAPTDGDSQAIELTVGRIDFSRMSSFVNDHGGPTLTEAENEIELLRRYLDKDHAYRNGLFVVANRAVVTNAGGNPDTRTAEWENYSAIVGSENVDVLNWHAQMGQPSSEALFASAAATSPTHTGINTTSPVFTTANIAATSTLSVFNAISSSYTVETNKTNDLLRALIANDGYSLTASWNWLESSFSDRSLQFQHMAVGETVGFANLVSQIGFDGSQSSEVWRSLQGDPTLRARVVTPPSGLSVSSGGSGASLSWTASADPQVSGYRIFKWDAEAGRFVHLASSGDHVSGTTFQDTTGNAASDIYMVRAVKLETTPSGTYWNASTGVISDAESVIEARREVAITSNDDTASALGGGAMTLRRAIAEATPGLFGHTTIHLPAGTFSLDAIGADDTAILGDLDILTHITIIGAGPGLTIIDAGSIGDRAFHILDGGSLELQSLTVTGGVANEGGAIRADSGAILVLDRVALIDNHANLTGGAIHLAAADATIINSVIAGNTVLNGSTPTLGGGGIYTGSSATLEIDGTIVAGNTADVGEANLHHVSSTGLASGGNNLFASASTQALAQLQGTDLVDPTVDYVVTTLEDTNLTTSVGFNLSVREAVMLANQATGVNTVWLPGWDFELSIERLQGYDTDASVGDLDVIGHLEVRGIENRSSVSWRPGIIDSVFELLGDYSQDGVVNTIDYAVWRDNEGYAEFSNLVADGNLDGVVDQLDYNVWAANYGASGQAVPGDYNNDGTVNAADYTVWNNHLGDIWSPSVTGDGDDDGDVDDDDWDIWSQQYGSVLSFLDIDI